MLIKNERYRSLRNDHLFPISKTSQIFPLTAFSNSAGDVCLSAKKLKIRNRKNQVGIEKF